MPTETCFICNKPATDKCSLCPDVWFCSKQHQMLHNDQTGGCFSFKIMTQPIIGRCLMATNDIKAGDVIFQETAISVGPNPISSPQCIECCSKVDASISCPDCGYPICSKCLETEPKLRRHHLEEECRIIRHFCAGKLNLVDRPEETLENRFYEPILPLRLFLTKWNAPHDFDILQTLMDHEEDRRADDSGEYWKHSCETVMNPLREAMEKEGFEVDLPEIAKMTGIAEVNNHEIYNPTGSSGYRGVFPLTSLMSHNCAPNCRMIMERGGFFGNVCIATKDILIGEELTIHYANLLLPSYKRRQILRENWYFECQCKRCLDPTECDSYIGSIKCDKCNNGYLLPQNPLDFEPDWSCEKCDENQTFQLVNDIVERLVKEKELLGRMDFKSYFEFMKRIRNKLHPNHFVITASVRWLIPLFCRNGQTVTRVDLAEKRQMCLNLIHLLDKLNPGLSKDRGKILFELAEVSMILKAESEEKIIELLRESEKCLRREPDGSFEKQVHDVVLKYINHLK